MPNHQEVERRGRPRKWAEIPLAAWMIASGIRAEDLADRLGVNHSTVYRWFRGEQNPTLTTAKAIAEIARRSGSGRKLSLEDILNPRRRPNTHDEEKHDGVLSRSTAEARDRRLATAQE
jgi:transcriptional regulator with XRE-family HTH domain